MAKYKNYVDEWNSGNWNSGSYRKWSKPTQTGVNTNNVRGSSGTGTYSVTPTFNNPVATTNNLGLRALTTLANKKSGEQKTPSGHSKGGDVPSGMGDASPSPNANFGGAGFGTPVATPVGGGYGYMTPSYTPYARWNSPWKGDMETLMRELLNRDPFNYDYLSDPVYQAYRQQYEFQGDRARENTIGDYARNTGGLASSWANTAGQLRQNNYNAQLNGLIPELENARYSRYMGDIETDLNNLTQLQNLESLYYNQYLNDRDYDWMLQQASQPVRYGSGGGSGSRSTSNQDSGDAYMEEMLQDFMKSGMTYEDYVRKYNLTSKEISFLKPYKDLGGSGASSRSGSLNLDTGTTPNSGGSSMWDYAREDPNEAIRKRIIAELMQKGYYSL